MTPAEFAADLSAEDRLLITLREQLYGGSWDSMLEDLKDRLKGRPYIFKLVNRIEEDVGRIEKLKRFENDNAVNLSHYLEGDEA